MEITSRGVQFGDPDCGLEAWDDVGDKVVIQFRVSKGVCVLKELENCQEGENHWHFNKRGTFDQRSSLSRV